MRLDEHQQIAWDCEITAAVLGNAAGEFKLVPLLGNGKPLSADEIRAAHEKQFSYVGILGFRSDGTFRAQLELVPFATSVMFAAALAFPRYVAERLTPKGDTVDFLERLYQLPDDRTEDPRD